MIFSIFLYFKYTILLDWSLKSLILLWYLRVFIRRYCWTIYMSTYQSSTYSYIHVTISQRFLRRISEVCLIKYKFCKYVINNKYRNDKLQYHSYLFLYLSVTKQLACRENSHIVIKLDKKTQIISIFLWQWKKIKQIFLWMKWLII
jgi:hypothetical protein